MPDIAAADFATALELHRRGDLAGAILAYRGLLAERTAHEGATVNLAVALRARGENAEALELLEQAARQWPNSINVLYNLGNALRDADRPEDAVARYRTILALEPGHINAATNLALILQKHGQEQAALLVYGAAMQLNPDSPELLHNLGALMWRRGDNDMARHCFEHALAVNPRYGVAWVSLGQVLTALDRAPEAEAAYRRALQLNPGDPPVMASLAQVLINQGRLGEALDLLNAALLARPDLLDGHLGRARALLLAGRLPEAWADYDWRWNRSTNRRPDFGCPVWDGRAPAGRTILVYAEQGLGDTIQFCRFLAPLAASGANVVLRCPEKLFGLMLHVQGISRLVAEEQPLPPDVKPHVQVSLIDLARLMRLTLDRLHTLPTGYLRVPAAPKAVLAGKRPLQVGVCWQGNKNHANDQRRSCPLKAMLRLAAVPGVRLVSLQVGEAARQLAQSAAAPLLHQPPQIVAGLLPTAQVIRGLDLVISVDTAIAHLAAAMGETVWTLLCHAPDWRWLLERGDTPWYPTMRLFRQPRPGDWDGLMEQVAQALGERVRGGRG